MVAGKVGGWVDLTERQLASALVILLADLRALLRAQHLVAPKAVQLACRLAG